MRSLAHAQLAEGPRWDSRAGRLLWVDIEAGGIHVLDGPSVACGTRVGCVAPWHGDTVLAALEDRLAAVDLATGAVRTLAAIPHAHPGLRANDGACDPAGRFWFGTMALDESPGAGALYRYDPDGRMHTVLEGLTIANGLGWSPDATRMYFADSPTGCVDVFAFDLATGALRDRRTFAEIEDGVPDGLTVDDEGGVWVAVYGGGEVRRFTPDGRVAGRVEVPEPNATSCCFAPGPQLYVTARGGLYVTGAPVGGPPATPFGGRSTAPSDAEPTSAR